VPRLRLQTALRTTRAATATAPSARLSSRPPWIEARHERILPTRYFHVVFTVPQELKPLALRNPVRVYDLLFAATSETLLDLGHDPERLGGLLGVTAVLHTWSRTLAYHPHIHCIVTGGGLAPDGATVEAIPDDAFSSPSR
jgi:hypothetical protein